MTTVPAFPAQALDPEALASYLLERLEDRVVASVVAYGQLTMTVVPDAVPTAVQLCRDDPRLGFDFFDFLCGVDERDDGFAVVIHLYSTRHRHHVQIRALAAGGRPDPRLPTISHLYAGANWHEREAYDMYGITFEGHPSLLPRILTVENFEGFPLRKDFLLMTREVKPWPGLKEPMEVSGGDGEADVATAGPGADEKAQAARDRAERARAKAAEARQRRAQQAPAASAGGRGSTAPPADVEQPAGAGQMGAEKAAALAAGTGDDQIAGDPRSAAAVADTAIAKDAAAGAVAGDTAAGAPGDEPGKDEPIEELAREAEIAGGGPPEGPGKEEPRALADDAEPLETRPLGDETGPQVRPTVAERPRQPRPVGTDADDRLRDLEADDDQGDQR